MVAWSTRNLCLKTIDEELEKFQKSVGEQQFQSGQYRQAAQLLRELILAPQFVEFLTLPAYDRVS